MCEITNKGTCFRRCLFLVEMRGIDSRRELRGLVGRGHDSPPDCRSVPLLLRSPSSLFAKNKQKKEALAFLQVLLSGGDEGDRTPYLLNAIQALSQHTRKRTPHRTKVATLHFTFTFFIIRLPFACKISLSDVE